MIKTIRDIISLNPLYKEFLAQLMEGGKKVADNPVHLADFGKDNPKAWWLGCYFDKWQIVHWNAWEKIRDIVDTIVFPGGLGGIVLFNK